MLGVTSPGGGVRVIPLSGGLYYQKGRLAGVLARGTSLQNVGHFSQGGLTSKVLIADMPAVVIEDTAPSTASYAVAPESL